MRQQINLYQDILIDKPEPLQSRHAWLAVLAVLVCLVVIALYGARQVTQLRTQKVELTQQIESDRQRVALLEKEHPEVHKNVLLEETITRLEREIRGQQQALDYFPRQDMESNAHMLASLEGLARNPLKGVWLNRVRIFERGEDVVLAGRSMSADLVPDYLSLLGTEHVLVAELFPGYGLSVSKRGMDGLILFLKVHRRKDNDSSIFFLNRWYEQRPLRERVIWLVCVLLVLALLMNYLFLKPLAVNVDY